MQADRDASRTLPYSWWWPLLAGAVAGVAMRLVFFGKPGNAYAAMTGTFIYLSPMIVGAVTVYVAETRKRRTWSYYFLAGIVANVFYVIGTLLVMVEGLVCAMLIVPLFALFGSLGALLMGVVCRVTRWPRQTLLSLGGLALVLAPVENAIPLSDRIAVVERSVVVNATPSEVWRQIVDARDIRPEEVSTAWLYRIGVPMPLGGTTRETSEGPIRRVTMGKAVYFDEMITDRDEPRYLRWRYRFYDDSFPPAALDDHVAVGGQFFDVTDTSYTLEQQQDATLVTMRTRYRVSTRFNWYADHVARLLMENLEDSNLGYYRRRAEAGNGGKMHAPSVGR